MTAWLKRIDLQTGAKGWLPLRREERVVVARVTDHEGVAFDEHVLCDGTSWFHVMRGTKQWLLHGSAISSGSAVYVFMEHPEARHAELEAALPGDPNAAGIYADWLEEQGDPFAAALKPELAKARGPAGLWWMEGFERSGAVTVTMRDGFVREAQVGPIHADQLLSTLHRLCHLRAFVALERLVIDPRALLAARSRTWGRVFSWELWTDCQWPRSLRRIVLAPRLEDVPPAPKRSVQALQRKLAERHPGLLFEA